MSTSTNRDNNNNNNENGLDADAQRRESFVKQSVEQQQLSSFDPEEDEKGNNNNDKKNDSSDEEKERLNRIRSAVRVTFGIVAVNATIYTMSNDKRTRPFVAEHCVCSYDQVVNKGRWYTLLTSGFTHISFIHFFANTLAFLSFAPPLIQLLGARAYLRWYLTAAVTSSAAFVAQRGAMMARESSPLKQEELARGALVGASGAVMQSVVFFGLRYPRSRLLLLFVLPVPTWLAVTGLLAWDYLMLESSDHIAHMSHLGGAGVGLLSFLVERRLRPHLFVRRQR
jgi:membrane associated rhomboid family serine protease